MGVSVEVVAWKLIGQLQEQQLRVWSARDRMMLVATEWTQKVEQAREMPIYQRVIPYGKNGPMWKRTGDLFSGTVPIYVSTGADYAMSAVDIVGPAAAYGERREGLGQSEFTKDWIPKHPAITPGNPIIRSDPFMREAWTIAVADIHAVALQTFAEEFWRV